MRPYGVIFFHGPDGEVSREVVPGIESFKDVVKAICSRFPEAVTDVGRRVADMEDPCGKVYYVFQNAAACEAEGVYAVAFLWTSSSDDED